MKIYYQLIVLVSVIFLLAGCFAGKTAPRTQYLFAVHYPKQKLRPQATHSIEVKPLAIAPQYANNEFVYRLSKYSYLSDYYHIFMTPAESQITSATAAYLMRQGLFSYVGDTHHSIKTSHYILRGTILSLYADYRDSNHPEGVMAIRYVLYDNDHKQQKVVLDKVYQQAVPLQAKTSSALMVAWSQDLNRILSHLIANINGMMSE